MDTVMQGGKKCGVQIMSNGNALINESSKGRITEVDNLGNVIWVYIIPVSDGINFNQFSQPIFNESFRAHRYPEDYSGFDNVVYNNTGIIEDVNSNSQECISLLSIDDSYYTRLNVYPNPTKDVLNFDVHVDFIEVYDLSGKKILSQTNSEDINLENLPNGLYIIKLLNNERSEFFKISKK